MGVLNTKGLNDIQSVAEFSQSANQLGLVDHDGQKLQAFVGAMAEAGVLEPGETDKTALGKVVEDMKTAGVLPTVIEDPQQVTKLVDSSRSLGINGDNLASSIPATLAKAEKAGISATSAAGGGRADLGHAITANRLHFAPYEFKDIHDLKISQGINEHARLFISGTLGEADSDKDYIQFTERSTPVALHYINEAGTVKCIFKGIVANIRQKTTANLKYLEVEAVSASYLLDIKKHSRSFQRDKEPYSYIFDKINKYACKYIDGLKGNILAAQPGESDKKTNRFIMQYHETDWEFLKRLASHFNLGLTPDVTSDNPQVYLGLPPEKEAEEADESQALNVSAYKMRRDSAGYAKATENWRENSGTKFNPNDFTYCEAQSINVLGVGQSVKFLDRNFYIKGINTFLQKGIVNSIYTLTTKPGLMQNDLYNNKFTGISLPGVVKKIDKDTVQVHFDSGDGTWAEEEYDGGGTWMFPYTTIYSSPDGSGWYCMPELEDKVRVYFPGNQEKDAVAASSINPIDENRGGRDDPDQKTISTVHGKKIIITPKGIDIIANDKLLLRLDDDGGLTINSDKKIVLQAEQDIEIISKDKIKLDSKKEISLTQGGSKIVVGTSGIDIKGPKVNLQ